MKYWHGFETARNVAQIYETTIADIASGLSAHFVTVPARSLGGSSYLFQGSDWPLETLGLLRIADVPFGGVARSLAACLVSDDVEEFLRRFEQGFEEETRHSSVQLPKPFVFAEYLTFARVIPFEQPSLGRFPGQYPDGTGPRRGRLYVPRRDENPGLGRLDPVRHGDLRFGARYDKSPRIGPQTTAPGAGEKPLRRTRGRRDDPLNTGQPCSGLLCSGYLLKGGGSPSRSGPGQPPRKPWGHP